ncbi:MAG: polysaccharide pyruvyl transferase family protein [Candidatus Saccharibacteria bacterium]|nr:polysaccharide pyruvyl transferase family protein [Candidatus Saccharibacteria bacterium]
MENKKFSFLLTGTYSSYNKGDAAMQLATAGALKKRWPNCEITISAPFPEYDKNLYRNYNIVRSRRRKIISSSFLLLPLSIYWALSKVGINLNFLLLTKELKAIKEADILIDLSGDTITEDYGPHVTYSHLLPIMSAHLLGTPVYICAQSMGPFKLTRWLVKLTLRGCAGITARERVTYEYLESLGLPKNKLYLESDMAFLLEPIPKIKINKVLQKEKVDLSKPLLGITVSGIIQKRFNKVNKEYFDISFANILDDVIDNFGVNVLFVSHVTGPTDEKDDRIVANSILANMKNRKNAFALNDDYGPQEVKGIISFCKVFLGSRMHSNIAALSTNVPTIALSYSHKTLGIMSTLGMQEYIIDAKYIDRFTVNEKLNDILENHDSMTKTLKSKNEKIKKSSLENVNKINNILKNN